MGLTVILLLTLVGALAYMIKVDPGPKVEISPERRAEILKGLRERRNRKRSKL